MSVVVEEGCVFYFIVGLLVECLLVLYLIEVMVEMVGNIMRMLEKFIYFFIEKFLLLQGKYIDIEEYIIWLFGRMILFSKLIYEIYVIVFFSFFVLL